ncbi:hypothetical protein K443DRAFT_134987 [Laccaria amethystina LaAM-08-1]|uniref:F-box domain-containing protein n=1 Tax=Laccaria amethystina LaAM-08-1 TaxID=1095629 RepID=A0A0C9WXM8_9AGAR|nr:hypothetical protein K443DRAFT_134987 [Laccaria amethystina LaAM-08-1]
MSPSAVVSDSATNHNTSNNIYTQSNATLAPSESKSNPNFLPVLIHVADAGNDRDPSPNQTALMRKVKGLLEVSKHLDHSPESVTPQCKAVVSPIRRIPTEIWAMIFVECLCYEDRCFIEAERDEAPLNVAGVCQRWRGIALSTPSLWSSIAITRTPALDNSYPRRELVSLWLSRSAPCSISFSFTIDMVRRESNLSALQDLWAGNKQNSPDQEALVGELLCCMSRWKSVQFALPFLNGYDIQTGAPLLERVKVIKGVVQSWSSFDPFIHRIWEDAPRLRIFSLRDDSDWSSRYEKDLLPVPIRLTELEIDYDWPFILCWLVLRESPELTKCNFGRFCGIDESGSHLPPVFLPKLHSLTVTSTIHSFDHGETLKLTKVLSLITAPNLKKFEMQWDNGYVHEPFMTFIARSACALTELLILSVPIPKREMKEVLEAISGSLKVLKVEVGSTGTPFGKDLLRSLTWRGPNEVFLCPNLERILLGRSAIGKRDSFFIRMVESRWHVDNGRVRLKEVEIQTSEERGPPPGFDQLESYRGEGLKLQVDYDWDVEIKSDTEGEDSD